MSLKQFVCKKINQFMQIITNETNIGFDINLEIIGIDSFLIIELNIFVDTIL